MVWSTKLVDGRACGLHLWRSSSSWLDAQCLLHIGWLSSSNSISSTYCVFVVQFVPLFLHCCAAVGKILTDTSRRAVRLRQIFLLPLSCFFCHLNSSTENTSISCPRWTRVTGCLICIMLYTEVNAQCDKLVTVVGRTKLTILTRTNFRPMSLPSLSNWASHVCVQHDAHEAARRAGPYTTDDTCLLQLAFSAMLRVFQLVPKSVFAYSLHWNFLAALISPTAYRFWSSPSPLTWAWELRHR